MQTATTNTTTRRKVRHLINPAIFTSLHSLHFTPLHFTLFYFLIITTPISLSPIYHFPNPFSKTARCTLMYTRTPPPTLKPTCTYEMLRKQSRGWALDRFVIGVAGGMHRIISLAKRYADPTYRDLCCLCEHGCREQQPTYPAVAPEEYPVAIFQALHECK
jgi:hypothetical protein